MNYEKLAARCLIVGISGPTPTAEELELVRLGIAGVILFRRNVVEPAQLAELSRSLKAAAPGPLLVSIDQEDPLSPARVLQSDRYVALETGQPWEWEGKVQGAHLSTLSMARRPIAAPGGE